MTRKTHTLLFGLALLGVTVLFALLVVREILVRMVGYEATGVDPVMLAVFAVVAMPTFGCVVVFILPKFFTNMYLNDTYTRPFSGPRKQVDVDRARTNLQSLGLLLEDGPSEENVATKRGKHDGSAHGASIKSKKVD